MASKSGRVGHLVDVTAVPFKQEQQQQQQHQQKEIDWEWSTDDDAIEDDPSFEDSNTRTDQFHNKTRKLSSCKGDSSRRNESCCYCHEQGSSKSMIQCKRCKDPYHIDCLLTSDNDKKLAQLGIWYCNVCVTFAREEEADDGLERMVSALGPEFTRRFGEICWAAGGPGFGWWPACIYDPRLTVSSARTLAKKNLGKKHLVYFFECHEAPFTVLPPEKLVDWEVGLVWDYDKGLAAKAGGMKRIQAFDGALHQALIEYNKPVDMRCDWNHNDLDQITGAVNTNPAFPYTASPNKKNKKKKKSKKALSDTEGESSGYKLDLVAEGDTHDVKDYTSSNSAAAALVMYQKKREKEDRLRRELKFLYDAKRQAKIWKVTVSEAVRRLKEEAKARNVIGNTSSSRSNLLRTIRKGKRSFDGEGKAIYPEESNLNICDKTSLPLICKIILRVEDQGIPHCLGYAEVPDRFLSDFATLRKIIESEHKRERIQGLPKKWRFHIPRLGPMSLKQEKDYAILPFIVEVGSRLGLGSKEDPLRIVIKIIK